MANLNIENAKKMADLTALQAVSDSDMLFIHDGTGLKKVSGIITVFIFIQIIITQNITMKINIV